LYSIRFYTDKKSYFSHLSDKTVGELKGYYLLLVMMEKTDMAVKTGERVQAAQPRAYQLELFEESMKRNVIVTVRTLKGLRI